MASCYPSGWLKIAASNHVLQCRRESRVKYSVMDPDQGVTKSLGYTTDQVWCRPGPPIITVSILVGSGDKQDHGKQAQIFIINSPGEDSCP